MEAEKEEISIYDDEIKLDGMKDNLKERNYLRPLKSLTRLPEGTEQISWQTGRCSKVANPETLKVI